MRTSIALWALALACCFSSAAAPASEVLPAAAERSLEMELELARSPELYLVLDPAAGRLEVKVRGMVLDSVELTGAALLVHDRGSRDAAALALPAKWAVSSVPDDSRRRVLEASRLKPYGEEDSDADASPAPSTPVEPEVHEPAASYRVPLEEGWELRVGPSVRRSRLVHGPALTAARWRARGSDEGFRPPDLLALALPAEEARRIHHLFRPGVEILAVARPAPPSGGEERP